jgi:hypothetical protein
LSFLTSEKMAAPASALLHWCPCFNVMDRLSLGQQDDTRACRRRDGLYQ